MKTKQVRGCTVSCEDIHECYLIDRGGVQVLSTTITRSHTKAHPADFPQIHASTVCLKHLFFPKHSEDLENAQPPTPTPTPVKCCQIAEKSGNPLTTKEKRQKEEDSRKSTAVSCPVGNDNGDHNGHTWRLYVSHIRSCSAGSHLA